MLAVACLFSVLEPCASSYGVLPLARCAVAIPALLCPVDVGFALFWWKCGGGVGHAHWVGLCCSGPVVFWLRGGVSVIERCGSAGGEAGWVLLWGARDLLQGVGAGEPAWWCLFRGRAGKRVAPVGGVGCRWLRGVPLGGWAGVERAGQGT